MKRFCTILMLAALILAGCSRPATQSSFSPIDRALAAETRTALPSTLGPTSTPVTEATDAHPSTTLVPLEPLDFSTLPAQLPAAAKGYELYSWQSGSNWNYTLITGTDRTKSMDEIMAPASSVSSDGFVKLSVSSLADLERLLTRLPAGTELTWGGIDLGGEVPTGTAYLTFPPQSILDEVSAFCNKQQLKLTSLKSQ